MSLQIVWEERAISHAADYLDDAQGLAAVLDAVGRLAEDPHPPGSFPYGTPDRRRLRVGRYRIKYDVTGELVSIWHLARVR